MAACKCRYCKTSLKPKDAYKTTIKDKAAYFCSEDHFDLYIKQLEEELKQTENNKQLKREFYRLFCSILGVSDIANTALWKEKSEINKIFSDEIVVAYLKEHKQYLTDAVCKLDSGIYGKIRYVGTAIKNSLDDFQSKTEEKRFISVVNEEHYETKFKLKVRKALLDFEEDYNE